MSFSNDFQVKKLPLLFLYEAKVRAMHVHINVYTNINMLSYKHPWKLMAEGTTPNEMLNLFMMPVQYLIFAYDL